MVIYSLHFIYKNYAFSTIIKSFSPTIVYYLRILLVIFVENHVFGIVFNLIYNKLF